MKKSKLCTLLMALALSCGALPVQAEEADTDSAGKSPVVKTPLSRTFYPSQISEAYLEWTEHPEGVRPSIMDLSYLSENDAEQYKKQHSGRTVTTELPEAFDLRDQGKALDITDQGVYGICWSVAANQSAAAIGDQEPGLRLSALHTAWFGLTGVE